MQTLNAYVSRPNIAPIVSTAQGTGIYRVAHRRVNKLGQVSGFSPIAIDRDFPMTVEPQSYQDSASLLRNQIVVSDDNGATWKIAYAGLSGSITLSGWSEDWPDGTPGDNQLPGGTLDAGSFDPGAVPTFDIFLVTESSSFSSVHLRLWDTITGNQALAFADLVQLTYYGSITEGTGALTAGSGSVIWGGTEATTSSLTVAGFPNQVHKFSLSFLGYPSGLPPLSLGLDLAINRLNYGLHFADDWPEGTIWLNETRGLEWPIMKDTAVDGVVEIERFAISGNGLALINPGSTTRTVANGTYWLSIDIASVVSLSTSLPSGNYPVAKATVAAGQLTSCVPATQFRSPRAFNLPGAGLLANRFVGLSNGLLTISEEPIGISVNNAGDYVTSGYATVEAGGTIAVGDQVGPSITGLAITSADSVRAIAISPATTGQLVAVQLLSGGGSGGAASFIELTDAPSSFAGQALKAVRVNTGADALEFYEPSFTNLSQTPDSFAGQALKAVQVNSGATGLEFYEPSFTNLSQTPDSYTGQAGKFVRVNSGATGLEFYEPSKINSFGIDYPFPAVRTYSVDLYCVRAYQLLSIWFRMASGSITFTLRKNGAAIAGLTGLVATTTIQNAVATAGNNFQIGDILTLEVTVSSNAVDFAATVETEYASL